MMPVKGIGINVDSSAINGDLSLLKDTLSMIQDVGFHYAEIPVHGVDGICNGKINRLQASTIKDILKKYHLKYTVHAPDLLNLMDDHHFQLQKEIFKSGVEFAHFIGSEIFVYHSGKILLQAAMIHKQWGHDHLSSIPSWQEAARLRMIEVDTLQEIASSAKALKVTIAIETANPGWEEEYLQESELLSSDQLIHYNYGLRLETLVEQVKKVDRENVAITMDFGHAYIASKYCRFNYIDAIQSALPYIRHVHIHDCFGKVSLFDEQRDIDLIPFGKGDMHMPIGWGEIPYDEIFGLLKNYDGVICLELKPRYKNYFADSLQKVKELIGKNN